MTKTALKDAKLIQAAKLNDKVKKILADIKIDPYIQTNNYEPLKFGLSGKHSRRINLKHRLVYEVDEKKKIIKIHRMWSHYDKIK